MQTFGPKAMNNGVHHEARVHKGGCVHQVARRHAGIGNGHAGLREQHDACRWRAYIASGGLCRQRGGDEHTVAAIVPAPTTQCILLVKPDSYALPSSGYPIVAISNLLANAQGNGSDLLAIANLLGAPYNATIQSSVATIGSGKGLAFLTGTGITQAKLSGCVIN